MTWKSHLSIVTHAVKGFGVIDKTHIMGMIAFSMTLMIKLLLTISLPRGEKFRKKHYL